MGDPLASVRAQLGEPVMELTFEDLSRLRRPLVYVWSRGEQVLYVGCSGNGIERPLAKDHERLCDFQPGDTLTVWRADSPWTLEAELIARLRPCLNREPTPRLCERCSRPRRSARYCAMCQTQAGRGTATIGER